MTGSTGTSGTRFAIRFDGWFTPLATAFGMTRRGSWAAVDDTGVEVRMGFWFHARLDRDAIASAAPDAGRVGGWGVHGVAGKYLVNGSSRGLVRIEAASPGRGRFMGMPVSVTVLRVSLTDPQGFLAALGAVGTGAGPYR